MNQPSEIEIYSVGLLHELAIFVHSPDRNHARRALRRSVRYLISRAKAGDWRAVKNHFNGYLAEPTHDVPGFTRCGTGWTRGRAYRDLQRHLAARTPGDAEEATTDE